MGLTSIIYKKIDKIYTTERFFRKKYRDLMPHVELMKNKNSTTINFIGESQTRAHETAKLLIDCLKDIQIDQDILLRFYINDKPDGYLPTDFYYCTDDDTKKDFLVPDFAFDSWPEIGVKNYTETVKEMEWRGQEKWTKDQVLWIGNIKTNKIRERLMEIGAQYPAVFNFTDTYINDYTIEKRDVPYVSLPDHTKYKYLIDVEGNSYSARLKFLFYTQRVVFLQDRPWKEFFHDQLIPYEHYVPVKNDLSDLYAQYLMIEKDPVLYAKIVKNALDFAHQHLSYDAALREMKNKISKRIEKLNGISS